MRSGDRNDAGGDGAVATSTCEDRSALSFPCGQFSAKAAWI
jgi:hypothetical protein